MEDLKKNTHASEFEVVERFIFKKRRRCKREKGTIGNLIGGFISIAIATTVLDLTTKSLKEGGLL